MDTKKRWVVKKGLHFFEMLSKMFCSVWQALVMDLFLWKCDINGMMGEEQVNMVDMTIQHDYYLNNDNFMKTVCV